MEAMNVSATNMPDAVHATISSVQTGVLSKMLENVNYFTVFLTLFAMAVVYDQSRWCLALNSRQLSLTVGDSLLPHDEGGLGRRQLEDALRRSFL